MEEFPFLQRTVTGPARDLGPYERPAAPLRGDANGDGKVDIADIATVLTCIADVGADVSKRRTADAAHSCDVNNDGRVDIADIIAIITIMADGQ